MWADRIDSADTRDSPTRVHGAAHVLGVVAGLQQGGARLDANRGFPGPLDDVQVLASVGKQFSIRLRMMFSVLGLSPIIRARGFWAGQAAV